MLRAAAVPLLAAAFYGSRKYIHAQLPAAIFGACAFTDWLDGNLARRWKVHSDFGAFLDPVADKVLVCTCLVLLSGDLGALVAVPTALIVSREVAVSALREWMGTRGERNTVAVGRMGKIKTAAQMVALLLLLLANGGGDSAALLLLRRGGLALLYLATVLTCTSAMGYFQAAWPLLNGESK